ncbi:regulation of peroxisome size [Coemansia thaxteri]|uniref:Regulation of peroxisome size n=1 Tax=Coemansia thaxteri TaxID=2663907 RepID=A0A9W8BM45_9FUNG|nr:regulation of peroxisome size [Coemansia thaxteri]KAJ2484930.1 regulation of peroxisome size [Coemansia sp. RSA 2320]
MADIATGDNSLEASAVLVDDARAGVAHTEASAAHLDTIVADETPRVPTAPSRSEKSSPAKRLQGNHVLALALSRMLKGPAPTLDHIIRFLSSGSGHDKFWMMTQYFTKVVVWLLAKRNQKPASERVRTLSNLVSDYRIMIRLTGLAPMAQYVRYAEQFPAQTRLLKWLDRIMNTTLVCYYPLEHIYWLGAHQILPFSEKMVDFAGYWSCRFWAVWVALQFVRLGEEYRLIKGKKQNIYTRDKIDAAQMQGELDAVDAEVKSWKTQLLINACYFPLTLHWSIRGSTFPDVAVGVCGTVAAVAQAYNVWKATA